jgi:hypothetical protein
VEGGSQGGRGAAYPLAYVDERLWKIRLKHAENLFTHCNPYTSKRYPEDEIIALVEINDEAGVIRNWLEKGFDKWPVYFRDKLQRQWNAWLAKRYKTDEALRAAWSKLDAGESAAAGAVRLEPTILTHRNHPEARQRAFLTFLDQVDSDGKPIGIMPAVLLVPMALIAMGTQLFKSLEIRDTTANTKFPVANPHQGKFRAEVSRYLANTKYTGASAKAWYLLADPADLPVIEVAFLNGQESPTIETDEADFNVLGIQMRGYHDFGVALQDPSVPRVEKVPFAWCGGQVVAAAPRQ